MGDLRYNPALSASTADTFHTWAGLRTAALAVAESLRGTIFLARGQTSTGVLSLDGLDGWTFDGSWDHMGGPATAHDNYHTVDTGAAAAGFELDSARNVILRNLIVDDVTTGFDITGVQEALVLENCTVGACTTGFSVGPLSIAPPASAGSVKLINCHVTGVGTGAGFATFGFADVSFLGCSATSAVAGTGRGFWLLDLAPRRLINCTSVDNSVGLENVGGDVTIIGHTFTNCVVGKTWTTTATAVDAVFKDCVFSGCTTGILGISTLASPVVVDSCQFLSCGISIDHVSTDALTVYNNFFNLGATGGPIGIRMQSNVALNAYNSTFVVPTTDNNDAFGIQVGGSGNIDLRNNVFAGTDDADVYYISVPVGQIAGTSTGNFFQDTGSITDHWYDGSMDQDFAWWDAVAGSETESENLPFLGDGSDVDADPYLYAVQKGSAVYASGTNLSATFRTAFGGAQRSEAGSTWNIGHVAARTLEGVHRGSGGVRFASFFADASVTSAFENIRLNEDSIAGDVTKYIGFDGGVLHVDGQVMAVVHYGRADEGLVVCSAVGTLGSPLELPASDELGVPGHDLYISFYDATAGSGTGPGGRISGTLQATQRPIPAQSIGGRILRTLYRRWFNVRGSNRGF